MFFSFGSVLRESTKTLFYFYKFSFHYLFTIRKLVFHFTISCKEDQRKNSRKIKVNTKNLFRLMKVASSRQLKSLNEDI